MKAAWDFHSRALNSTCVAESVRVVAVRYSIVSFSQKTPVKILGRRGIAIQGSIYLNACHSCFPGVSSGSFL